MINNLCLTLLIRVIKTKMVGLGYEKIKNDIESLMIHQYRMVL